ncbi:hypothetical protein [uncultured Desulfovibrio sp.]|uniref:hypothetical protein n=1 Tax=uncultured Desulfovibrio sp. TaxID=167968 RepID=UPI00262E5792|nr:hypothetical protein [uncultured Desulfovibrio sp.]
MSYPGFIRRLFANEGADPLLRKEIIPFGDTEGTVCEGSDARLAGGADWSEHKEELLKFIEKMEAQNAVLEALRIQAIGAPRYWTSTQLPADHCWPDGSLVLFEDRPELKAKYDAGGFEGMLLEADSDADAIAANLGKWVEHPNSLGLYTPQLGGQFFRNWALGDGQEAGAWGRDEIRNIWGSTYQIQYLATSSWTGAFFMSAQGMMGDYPAGVAGHRAYDVAFDASRVVPTGPENVPQHIWQPVILYLGRPR